MYQVQYYTSNKIIYQDQNLLVNLKTLDKEFPDLDVLYRLSSHKIVS